MSVSQLQSDHCDDDIGQVCVCVWWMGGWVVVVVLGGWVGLWGQEGWAGWVGGIAGV